MCPVTTHGAFIWKVCSSGALSERTFWELIISNISTQSIRVMRVVRSNWDYLLYHEKWFHLLTILHVQTDQCDLRHWKAKLCRSCWLHEIFLSVSGWLIITEYFCCLKPVYSQTMLIQRPVLVKHANYKT